MVLTTLSLFTGEGDWVFDSQCSNYSGSGGITIIVSAFEPKKQQPDPSKAMSTKKNDS
ncbi:hypothetical protein Fmac_010559 [Flemingia macrophylla]|uniref:Uncharacterized protein n=1 Tax=Flemingia macrophylla TaxID=520843 RepID=A0ABD1MJZ7_9FABA